METPPRVAVVVPAYNEEAIHEFLAEIEESLAPVTASLTFLVVDDCSTQELELPQGGACLPLGSDLQVLRNTANRGHGPTALRAWSEGLLLSPDVVLHVDGDGQFLGEDFPLLLSAMAGRDGVVGRRRGRREPWFRRILSWVARSMVGEVARDVNSPLRAYRPSALQRLIAHVPCDSVVPHLHFAALHHRLELDVHEIEVTHRERRGHSAVGTTWQTRRRGLAVLPPRRLLTFAWTAWRELRDHRPVLRHDVPEAVTDAA